MVEVDGTKYKLGLLDTCIISKILENSNSEQNVFIDKFIGEKPATIPCITIWSILELRQRKEIYLKFIDLFSIIPFCIMKTPDHILKDEYENYPYINKVDPILFTFSFVRSEEESLKNVLSKFFTRHEIKQAEKDWKFKLKQESLNSMLRLRSNFISSNKHLNANDAKKFMDDALPQYITYQNPSWVEKRLKRNESIIFDAFPSAKSALYTVFYRFYVANRKPVIQDVFDILINNTVPYIDYVITENFQADILRKIKKADEQFSHIEIDTIRVLRK